MRNFFYLQFKDELGRMPAYARNPTVEYLDQLKGEQDIPFLFEIQGGGRDYQPNDLGWPLMSERMKHIFDGLNGDGKFSWHKVVLLSGMKSSCYYVPRFLREFDVLDRQKSRFVGGAPGGVLIKAYLSDAKIGENQFFPLPGSDFRIVVSERLKIEMENEKLTGIDFSSAPVI